MAAFACAAPDFSFLLADKLLALAELAKIPAILVLNKEDNAPAGLIDQVKAVYEPIGYEVYTLSAQNGTGVEALRERLRGKICAFGGCFSGCRPRSLPGLEPRTRQPAAR